MKNSPLMNELLERLKVPGATVARKPGGYWCVENKDGESVAPTYGTKTIAALIQRGLIEHCEWRENSVGRFGVRCALKA